MYIVDRKSAPKRIKKAKKISVKKNFRLYELSGPLELDRYQNVEENVTESVVVHSEGASVCIRTMQIYIMQCWSETDGWIDGAI